MWDAIVTGSGIGGLAAAAALARAGRRVLVLEQHTVPGGETQVFTRDRWTFATGVHYLGGVGPVDGEGGAFGRVLDWLSGGALRFASCANPYDIVEWPGFSFGVPAPREAHREALHRRFPGQGDDIDAWFTACDEARRAAFTLLALHALPPLLAFGLRLLRGGGARRLAQRTVADAVAGIADPRLRGLLAARWGDHGVPPERAPLVEHALVMASYDDGAAYPVGGPGRFAQVLVPVIEAAGGRVRTAADVHRIRLVDGRAAGVSWRDATGQAHEEHAPWVVSAMGLSNTLAAVDDPAVDAWRAEAARLRPGLGHVAVYLGFEGDIAAAGATSANRWIYQDADVGRVWRRPADEDAPALFVSFPSLKDPSCDGLPTAELLAPVDLAAFAPWLDRPDGARDEDYLALKDWIGERLLAQLWKSFPGLKPMLRFHELATPLTQRHFVRTPSGSMVGLEMSAERMASGAVGLRTPLPGLLLAGQDVGGPGVEAACMTGLMAAATIEPSLWRRLRG